MQRIATAMTFAFLGLGVVPASAQTNPTPVPVVVGSTPPDLGFTFRRAVGPAAVVDRILSFDADGDDRVTAAELPERMQSVAGRIDQDNDGFLTAAELLAAVDRKPVILQDRSFVVRRSASGLSDVIQDLKLPQPKHDRAIEIVKNYQVPRNLNNSKSIDLDVVHAAMKELLDEEEFGDFMAASARLSPRNVTVGVIMDNLRLTVRPDN